MPYHTNRLTTWQIAVWLVGLITLAGWLYWPALEAGFISDFTGHQMLFENGAALGWWNSYGWHGNQPVLFGLMNAWYHWFGIQPLPWYWLFIGFHAANALLLGLLGYRVWERAADASLVIPSALVLSVFYVIHPYQTEVVVWKVCLHYLISTAALFGALLLLFRLQPLTDLKQWIILHTAFLVALFSLELALVYPVILGLSVWWWGSELGWSKNQINRLWLRIGIPQFTLILGYFLLNKSRMGVWVGHYGDDVHLRFSIKDLAGNALNYLVKYLAFSRDWAHEAKAEIADLPTSHPAFVVITLGLLLAIYIVLLVRHRRLTRLQRTTLWASGLYPLALAPVLSLYFAWIGYVENDRYGYLAAAFFLLAVQSVLLHLPKWLLLATWIGLLTLQFNLSRANIHRWRDSQRLFQALLDDWRWTDAQEVFVLGVPDNYQGISVFRSFVPGESLRDGLRWTAKKQGIGPILEVAAFQVTDLSDGLEVSQLDSVTWAVDFRQWGNWFLRKGLGASDFQENGYQVAFHEGGYRIRFDEVDPTRILIYADGGRWIQVPFKSN